MTVTVDQMRDRLTSLDDFTSKLHETEPLGTYLVDPDSAKFELNNWNADPALVNSLSDNSETAAQLVVGGIRIPLTKEALLDVPGLLGGGLSKAFITKNPSEVAEPALNYWAQQGTRDIKLLTTRGVGSAFTRATVEPFSNLALLDHVLSGIDAKLGDQEILVDYKSYHSLAKTKIRLVLPQQRRLLEGTGTENDEWSLGLQITNSLTGVKQTSIEGYLFRWTCTNGQISTHASSGVWSRKTDGQGEGVYSWAREAVDGVLGGLEWALDEVQASVDVPVTGAAVDILRDIYREYKIPANLQDLITGNMVEATDLNMYTVMQAITQVANDHELSEDQVERLLLAGGELPHTVASRCESCHRRYN